MRWTRLTLTGWPLLLALLADTGSVGAQSPPPPPAPPPGIVIVVDGIGGVDLLALSAQMALPRAGVPHEIRRFVWSHGLGQMFKDLQDQRHLLSKADELVAQVRQLKAEDPARPVYLIGRSAGTALVLAAAEKLPPATLERIILLAPAVSPTYDLRPALCATRGEIVSFNSTHDQFILNWGTRQFGTADRVYGPSAGLRGFVVPAQLDAADRALYERLVQVPWNPRMLLTGHVGNHMGTGMPVFVGREVAPWLK
jgi:hypothetical protein